MKLEPNVTRNLLNESSSRSLATHWLLSLAIMSSILMAGCQMGSWSKPKFPKLSWQDRPRLFGKKESESIGPPPQYFEEDETVATKSDVEINVDPGTPERPPTTNPRKVLEPDQTIAQNDPKVVPLTRASSNPSTSSAAIRQPYRYEPASSDSLKAAASKLENDLDRLRSESQQDVQSLAAQTQKEINEAATNVSAFAGIDSKAAAPEMTTQTNTMPSAAPVATTSSGSFQGLSSANSLQPQTPFSNSTATTATPTTTSMQPSTQLAPIEYPKTAQAENRFQNLSQAVQESYNPQNSVAGTANGSQSTAPSVASNNSINGNASSYTTTGSGGFQALEPVQRNAAYSIETPSPKSVAPAGRLAELPQELLGRTGNYAPGSTGRLQGKMF